MRRIVLSVLLLLGSALSPLTALADMSAWPCGGQRIELSTTDPDELRAYMFRCSDPSLTAQTVSTDNECGGRRIELSNTDPNELKAFMFRCSAPSVTASRVVPDPSCGGRRIELSHTDPKELRALMFRCSAGLPQGPEVLAVRVNDGPVQEVEEDDTDDSGDTDADSGGNGDGCNTGGGSTGGCLNCVDGQPDTSRGPFDEFRSFRHCTPRPEPKVEQQHHIMEDGRLATGGSIRTFDGASHNRYGNFFAMTFDTDSGERHSTVQLDLSGTIRSSEYETLVWKVFVNDTSLEEDFAVCLADSRGDCSRDAELRRHADRRNSPAWQMVYIPVDDFRESRIGAVNFTREGTGPAVVMRDLYLTNLTIAEINGETPDYDEACDAIYASPERDPNRIRQAVEPWGEGTVRVGVKDLGGYTLNVWSYPSREDGRIRASYAYGETGTIVGGPYEYAGYVWWKVEWESGVTGWSVQEKLDLAYRLLGYGSGGDGGEGTLPTHSTGMVFDDGVFGNGWRIVPDSSAIVESEVLTLNPVGGACSLSCPVYAGTVSLETTQPVRMEPMRAVVLRVKGIESVLNSTSITLHDTDGFHSTQVELVEHMVTSRGGSYDVDTWYTVVISADTFQVDSGFAVHDVTIDYVVSGELQVDGLWFVEGLHFPVQGYEPESAVISSVFDHSIPGDESPWWDGQTFQPRDFLVVAYTGESGDGVPHGIDDTCVRSAEHPDREFVVNGNYKGAQSCGGSTFLSYDTHVGIDWVFDVGNVKVAPANGVITERTQCDENSCWGTGKVEIDHDGPYASVFEHTRRLFDGLAPGMRVHAGQPFAYSGDTGGFAPHVHHSVTLENPDGSFEYVDPYGWNGAYQDPYRHRAVNVRLWR